jgi:transcription elongation factor Elf1
MNSDDELDKVLAILRERYQESRRFTCDFCGDEKNQSLFVNHDYDSVICWDCVNKMHAQLANLEWVNNVNWDKLSRH